MDLLHPRNSAGGEVHTPLRKREFGDRYSLDDSPVSRPEEQLDRVASKVNETIQAIKAVYLEIGFSDTEVALKKSEVFEALTETISTFSQNLQREKTSIQNECNWLRQQIRLIFLILNEDKGERIFSLADRWLLYQDDAQLQQEIAAEKSERNKAHKLPGLLQPRCSFADLLLVSSSSDSQGWVPPSYSLLQTKSRLNSMFLEALKVFLRVFRKFNQLNVAFWESIDVILEHWSPDPSDSFLCSIPSKAEADAHAKLIKDFDGILALLKLENRSLEPNAAGPETTTTDDQFAFIISNPSKRNARRVDGDYSARRMSNEDEMSRLRDVNYSIVRAIRSLKISRFTSGVIENMRKAVENTEDESRTRVSLLRNKLAHCLALADELSLARSDVILYLKEPELLQSGTKELVSSEGQIEVETLHFIHANPHELGLRNQHINFISKLLDTLQTIKQAKEERLAASKLACVRLWDTLTEPKDYVEHFLIQNDNLTDKALYNFETELRRLQEKRCEFMEEFILLTRKEIDKYNDMLFHATSQRKQFKYHDLDLTLIPDDKELILSEHEKELDSLKAEYQAKLNILSLYAELKEHLENQRFLVESSKNSKRLLEKNACQKLLHEERIRKKVQRHMPRVLSAIKSEIIRYNNDLLATGGRPINVGDLDLLEEVLVIEAEAANQQTTKSARSRPGREITKAVSPSRSVTSSRASSRTVSPVRVRSPIKARQSPQRLTKFAGLRCTLSPTRSDKLRAAPIRSPISLAHGSRIPSLAAREPLNFKSSLNSPPERSLDTFTSQSSPQQASGIGKDLSSGRELGALLKPLNSPLPPESTSNEIFSDIRDSSTLYSTCSRLSPLRADRLSNIQNRATAKKPASTNKLDKENESKTNASDVLRYDRGMDSYLSPNSFANSTILGDDYQTWREERIKELNRI